MIHVHPNIFSFPKIFADTLEMPLTEWRQIRKMGIGGSEAAAVMGLAKYSSPITVYYDKTEDGPDKEDSEKMEAGRRLEPVIAEWFAEKTGKTVIKQPYMYQHPKYPWMLANVDFAILDEDAGVECKNTSYERDMNLDEEIVRDEHYLQCAHYMAVTGAKRWYLVYLVEGWKLRWVCIERDEDLIETLIANEKHFWETFIVPRQPPVFDGSNAATELLKKLYPQELEGADPVDLPEDVESMWEKEQAITKQMTELEKQKKEIRNQICSLMGNSGLGMTPSYMFTWNTVSREGYEVKPTSYRQLKAKKRKA